MRHVRILAALGLVLLAGPSQAGVPTMFPPYPYRPKEFAFIYAQGLFHLFYMRHAMNAVHADSTELDFGHAVSQDLMTWTQRDPILHVRSGNWDDLHVWAPSIIWQHGTYYLFYAGVTKVPYPYRAYQRIGVATSEDLENWVRYDAPVFGGNQVPWVFADSSQFAGCQFRDPFVMVDPGQSDTWLMYYCAAPKAAPSQLITGVARNGTGLSAWEDLMPMWNTDAAHFQGYTESPHVFSHAGRWYLFFTTNSGHPIRYQHSASPTADSTGWIGTYRLFDNEPGTDAWFGPEFLRVGSHEYFAAINSSNNGIEIREMSWTGVTSFTLSKPSVVAVPDGAEAEAGAPSVTPLGNGQGGSVIRFRVDLPSTMAAEVSIHDVAGRRIRSLHHGSLPGGRSTFDWDRKDYAGRELGAGIYIVRLDTALGSRYAKAAVLR
jgi:sucrose-6-phosphate hydrolase SacC (GH32 family)